MAGQRARQRARCERLGRTGCIQHKHTVWMWIVGNLNLGCILPTDIELLLLLLADLVLLQIGSYSERFGGVAEKHNMS